MIVLPDEKIVDLYFKKDEQAIEQSSLKYGRKLRAISYNIVNNILDSEECESDTYLSAWKAIPPKNPKTYLFPFFAKITRNISINLYNKNNAQKRTAHIVQLTKEMQQCIPSPNNEPCKNDKELSKLINIFLDSLKQEQRQVFVARYWFAYSVKDIAQKFGISESKTKVMLMRTRNKMKEFLQKEGVDL